MKTKLHITVENMNEYHCTDKSINELKTYLSSNLLCDKDQVNILTLFKAGCDVSDVIYALRCTIESSIEICKEITKRASDRAKKYEEIASKCFNETDKKEFFEECLSAKQDLDSVRHHLSEALKFVYPKNKTFNSHAAEKYSSYVCSSIVCNLSELCEIYMDSLVMKLNPIYKNPDREIYKYSERDMQKQDLLELLEDGE